MITVDELKAKLRQQGIDKLSDVRSAFMESDGEISAIRTEGSDNAKGKSQKHPAGVK